MSTKFHGTKYSEKAPNHLQLDEVLSTRKRCLYTKLLFSRYCETENYHEIPLTPLAGLWESRPLLVCRLQELHINGKLLQRFFLFLYYITTLHPQHGEASLGLSVRVFRVFLCLMPRIWQVLCRHSLIIIQGDTYENIFRLPSPHTTCNLALPLATSGILDPWAWKFLQSKYLWPIHQVLVITMSDTAPPCNYTTTEKWKIAKLYNFVLPKSQQLTPDFSLK